MRKAGYKSRRKVRADIEAGALHPFISIPDYGRYADAEVRKWLGLESWSECWGIADQTYHIAVMVAVTPRQKARILATIGRDGRQPTCGQ